MHLFCLPTLAKSFAFLSAIAVCSNGFAQVGFQSGQSYFCHSLETQKKSLLTITDEGDEEAVVFFIENYRKVNAYFGSFFENGLAGGRFILLDEKGIATDYFFDIFEQNLIGNTNFFGKEENVTCVAL